MIISVFQLLILDASTSHNPFGFPGKWTKTFYVVRELHGKQARTLTLNMLSTTELTPPKVQLDSRRAHECVSQKDTLYPTRRTAPERLIAQSK